MKNELKPRTGGQLVVDALKVHGVDTAFCVPGESFLAVLDALYDAREAIKLIVCRQEGGAANMAEAYGKLTDRKSTRLNSSHSQISYAVFCLKKNKEGSISVPYPSMILPINDEPFEGGPEDGGEMRASPVAFFDTSMISVFSIFF